ncbi:hypothetical protein CWC19_20980 [Pseudoalteromonas aurantia]|uniref:Uncharacterized protein n=1 Tax=Pseudoalteromonas aurantia TaxID=43654 RepID=A0A5S3UVQ7_9GAMM|nr:hypothetical protein CWC19_20980 [Pseudoalteromonas aurantia]
MKNSNKLLILMVLTFFSYTLISNPKITSVIYLTSTLIVIIYSILKKEINMLHISSFISLIYAVEYTSIGYYEEFLTSFISDSFVVSIFYYLYQIAFSLIGIVLFIFRVQVSRVISKSKHIKLTPFDNLLPWIYMYNFIAVTIHSFDYYLDEIHQVKTLSFFYIYYEEILYLGMSMIITILVSMVIYHEKEKIQNNPIEN